MVILDTNIICRFFLKENPIQHQQALRLISQKDYYLDTVILAEVIWVLTNLYKIPKMQIIDQLIHLVNYAQNPVDEKSLLLQSLHNFKVYSVSYVDSWLITINQAKQLSVATFDKRLTKLAVKYDSPNSN